MLELLVSIMFESGNPPIVSEEYLSTTHFFKNVISKTIALFFKRNIYQKAQPIYKLNKLSMKFYI